VLATDGVGGYAAERGAWANPVASRSAFSLWCLQLGRAALRQDRV